MEHATYGGYAYRANEEFETKRIRARYKELQPLAQYISIDNRQSVYAAVNFSGYVSDQTPVEITAEDILIFADSGNLCFGGSCELNDDGTFTGRYYTD